MTTFTRRGACPALSAPMLTGDGLLVRLNPVAGEIAPKALIGLCKSALRHGNGIIEITARGSIQIRGLTAASAALLAGEVDALGIAVRTGVPVDTSPLAGIDPAEIADPTLLAAAIRQAISNAGLAARLGPKVSGVVDGRGQIGLGTIMADVRLTALDASHWRLSVAGNEHVALSVGEFDTNAACDATLAILHSLATLGIQARARDLGIDALRSTIEALGRSHSFAPPSVLPDISPSRGENGDFAASACPAKLSMGEGGNDSLISPLEGEMSGRTEGGGKDHDLTTAADDSFSQQIPSTDSSSIRILSLSDGRIALGVALPFGSIRAEKLITFCEAAIECGATDMRPSPGRALLVMGLDHPACDALSAASKALDFVTSPTDPRTRIAACPGAPACASGMIAARDVAAEIAADLGESLDPTLSLHVSGCAKGCAHPGPASLTIVGDEKGAAFVVGGTAKGLPAAYTAGYEAARGMGRLTKLLAQERKPDEDAAACLARLGAKRLAQALAQE